VGGIGSGRCYHSGKDTTSDFRALDIRRLKKEGLLRPGTSCGWNWSRGGVKTASINISAEIDRINLSYKSRSNGSDWKLMEYPVYLEWTECNLGGQRVWFTCPAKGCGARVAVLYGGAIFACRKCHDLAYASQRESYSDRAMRRADKIREKLGWESGIANPRGGKPKGMHGRTFDRLTYKYNSHATSSWEATAELLESFRQRKI
jgi:hypothetical protein